jgi:hypothetical protein
MQFHKDWHMYLWHFITVGTQIVVILLKIYRAWLGGWLYISQNKNKTLSYSIKYNLLWSWTCVWFLRSASWFRCLWCTATRNRHDRLYSVCIISFLQASHKDLLRQLCTCRIVRFWTILIFAVCKFVLNENCWFRFFIIMNVQLVERRESIFLTALFHVVWTLSGE